jgi:hypothetical protein
MAAVPCSYLVCAMHWGSWSPVLMSAVALYFLYGLIGSAAFVGHAPALRAHECSVPIPCTSAPGPGSPVPGLTRARAHPCHIGTGTKYTLPHLQRDWARHICAGIGQSAATSAPGLGPPPPRSALGPDTTLPHLHRDWTGGEMAGI